MLVVVGEVVGEVELSGRDEVKHGSEVPRMDRDSVVV